MPASGLELARIQNFDDLLVYLEEELDWPIDEMDIDDLTFEYEPEELGLDPKSAAKVKVIKQLRPLESQQPFGIFFIEFEPKRLPVTALRRILARLVTKKRASADRAERKTWDLDDLIFVSNYGDEETRRIDFAHFADDSQNGLPTLRVLGWDADDTARRIDLVETRLKTHLAWEDGEEPDDWRQRWRSGFIWEPRQVPKTTRELVSALAKLAIRIRDKALRAMDAETSKGPIRKLHAAFRDSLIHDLDEKGFADMYAQTITYGLLSARISRPAGLVTDDIAEMVTSTSPFLKELMQEFIRVGGRQNGEVPGGRDGIDFDELGVNEVVELLRDTDMEPIVADFGRTRAGEDPIIHFYEDFMKQYDAQQRVKRGIYYTPKPVVSFIVRSVDEILREEFGLPLGLADTSTWGEMSQRHEYLTIPKGISEDDHFVQILDPACGTGTFLVETIDLIHSRMKEHWLSEGYGELELETLWNDYVAEHLLPRLYGFELMMAPYAICHMKVGLKLAESGYQFRSSERLRAFLTNSLEPPQDLSEMLEFVAPFLAHEARAANLVKAQLRPVVVIGNPPYSGFASNQNDWIRSLVEPYKVTVRHSERQIQRLSNDYVYFVRLAEVLLGASGHGVLGFVTDHGYLDGTLFVDMRRSLRQSFGQIRCLNLHGAMRRVADGGDQNVFDITQGVAVGLMRLGSSSRRSCVEYGSLTGGRQFKYELLQSNTSNELEFHEIEGDRFVPTYVGTEYDSWASLPILFGSGDLQRDRDVVVGTGVKTRHDSFVVGFDPAEATSLVKQLAFRDQTNEELTQSLGLCTTAHFDIDRARRRAERGNLAEHVKGIRYRPFDTRYIVYLREFVCEPKAITMAHMTRENVALCVLRRDRTELSAGAFVGRGLVAKDFVSNLDDALVIPVLRVERGLNRTAIDHAANISQLGVKLLNSAEVCDLAEPSHVAFHLLHYVYAILHSPHYRQEFRGQLSQDFPRIPSSSRDTTKRLAKIGADLVALHLLEDDYEHATWNQGGSGKTTPFDKFITSFDDEGDREVRRVGETHRSMSDSPDFGDGIGRVYINDTAYFDGVPEEVWNFHIGGYQVCHKWLSDRKKKGGKNARPGRVLTDDDINHYHRIVIALNETIRLMGEIDEVIQAHGGWPDAFVTNSEGDVDE